MTGGNWFSDRFIGKQSSLQFSEFTCEVVMTFLFYQLSFLEFDVNVFNSDKAILSLLRFFNLNECREVIVKKFTAH